MWSRRRPSRRSGGSWAVGVRPFATFAREFLANVAAEALAERSDALHERTVARYALGRGVDFDGRTDALARVRAIRVRRALDAYCSAEGAATLSASPCPRAPRSPSSRPHPARPGLPDHRLSAIRCRWLSCSWMASGSPPGTALLAQAVASRLADFPGLTVVLAARRHAADARTLGRELDVRFLLLCSVSGSDAGAWVRTQLLDTVDESLLWSGTEEVRVDDGAAFEEWAVRAAGQSVTTRT